MSDHGPYPTRLAALLAGRHQTREEVLEDFYERARKLGEPATLSLRQLDRWLTGQMTGLPRPTACRVAEALWGEPIQRLLAPPEPELPALPARSVPLSVEPLAVSLPNRPAAADPELVPHWQKLLGVFAVSENLFGPQHLTGTVMRELAVIRATREAARDPLRTAFVQVEARWSEFLSWLADNAGDNAAGQYWADRAVELALEAGDHPMTSYVLMRKSQQAVAQGDAARAIVVPARPRPRLRTGPVRARWRHQPLGRRPRPPRHDLLRSRPRSPLLAAS